MIEQTLEVLDQTAVEAVKRRTAFAVVRRGSRRSKAVDVIEVVTTRIANDETPA